MSVNLSAFAGAGWQFFNDNGDPLTGGKLYTYAAGTTTPAVTYTSQDGGTAHSNPIILDAAGRVADEIWLSVDQTYKFQLKDANDVLIGTYDNIYGVVGADIPGTVNVENFTGNGTQTTFILSAPPGGVNNTQVFINGVYQFKNTYSVSGATLTFTQAPPPAASKIEVLRFSTFSVGTLNADQVIYDPAGTGAVATTAEAKLRESVSVKDFGAVGDGITNDTAAVQAAINAADAVYFPTGTYLLNTVTLKTNSFLFGDGAATILKQNTITAPSYGTLFADSGSASTTIDNIVIRDMRLESPNIVAPVFNEFQHLISLNGVRNVLIENVDFIGFYGDGLYFGSGPAGGQERHNFNMTVRSCFFDGVNKENRQGISVIDGNGVLIDGNYFTRTTKSTMPGAIDIEPDSALFHVIADIKVVNNKFYDIGGNVGVCAVVLPATFTTAPYGFVFDNNYIDTFTEAAFAFIFNTSGGISEATANFGVVISNNIVKTGVFPFQLRNAKDLDIINNSFTFCTNQALVGFTGADINIIDVNILNNLFYRCGTTSQIGMTVFKASRLNIKGNEFNDCGTGTPTSYAINFNTGVSSSVSIIENNFTSPTGKTAYAIQKEAGHTFTPQTNIYANNRLNGLTNVFDWRFGDIRYSVGAPTTGDWVVGQYVYNPTPASGQPQGWVCTVSGTPGTWKAMANLA